MAVQERSGLLAQPTTLRVAELIEQPPMFFDSDCAARLRLRYGFCILH